MSTYYKNQLALINAKSIYPPKIKLFNDQIGEPNTNFLSLNPESAQVLIEWLTENFLHKPAAKSKQQLETVTLKRVKVAGPNQSVLTTTAAYKDRELFATYPANLTQPSKNRKTIIINGFKYNVVWE